MTTCPCRLLDAARPTPTPTAGMRLDHLLATWGGDAAGLALHQTQRLLRVVAEMPSDHAAHWYLQCGTGVGSPASPDRLSLSVLVTAPTTAQARAARDELLGLLTGPDRTASWLPMTPSEVEGVLKRLGPPRVAVLPAGLTGPRRAAISLSAPQAAPGAPAIALVAALPVPDAGHDLCAAVLAAGPRSAYRVCLQPVDDTTSEARHLLARGASEEALGSPGGLAAALRSVGTPLRVQAGLNGAAATSARARGALRALAGPVRFTAPAGPDQSPDPSGSAVLMGTTAASALVRLPVTTSAAAPGLAVQASREVPLLLDPGVPTAPSGSHPSAPLALGTATDALGAVVDVVLAEQDAARHVHIFGQTGTGKSTLMEHMIRSAAAGGQGIAVLDAHGHLAERVLQILPAERQRDVLAVDSGDRARPVPLSPLADVAPHEADRALHGITEMFYDLFDPDHTGIVGPRFEQWLQMGLRTLYDADGPRTSVLDIPRLFTDTDFLRQKFRYLRDPVVIHFWTGIMSKTSDYHRSEMLGWFTSKWARLEADQHLRAVLGSGHDAVNVRDAMDQGRIVVIDLAKGKLSELGSALLGYIYLSKFWRAAQHRGHHHGRATGAQRPFTLFVDEAHTFKVGPLPPILAEGRKFGLRLVMAHTHQGQLGAELASALRGNTGTTIAFRTGIEDAVDLSRRWGEDFPPQSLTRLPNHTAAASMLRRGTVLPTFTLTVPPPRSGDPAQSAALWALGASALGRPPGPARLRRTSLSPAAPPPPVSAS